MENITQTRSHPLMWGGARIYYFLKTFLTVGFGGPKKVYISHITVSYYSTYGYKYATVLYFNNN